MFCSAVIRGTRLNDWKMNPISRLRTIASCRLIQFADVAACQHVRAGRGDVEASEQVHEGGLSGAGWSHDREVVARIDAEVDAAEGVHLGVAGAVELVDAAELENAGLAFRLEWWSLAVPAAAEVASAAAATEAAAAEAAATESARSRRARSGGAVPVVPVVVAVETEPITMVSPAVRPDVIWVPSSPTIPWSR